MSRRPVLAALAAVAGIGSAPVRADPAPQAALEDAPPADRASGVAVAPPRHRHRAINRVLAAPRAVIGLVFLGPRLAAAGLDSWLERRSANAFGRDTQTRWRGGFVVDWEPELGASLGLRVGYAFAAQTSADVHAGLLGSRGESAGLRLALGEHTALRLRPKLALDAGRDMARVFAGVGALPGMPADPYAKGPRHVYDERSIVASAGLAADLGPIVVIGRGVADQITTHDESDEPLGAAYDTAMLVGYGERQRATTGEVSVLYDGRRATRLPYGGPLATGFYARGTAGYTSGDATRTGAFSTGRFELQAQQLFDLFHGDRVLTIGARAEAITAGVDEVPFTRLPSLGGRAWMRAFARDELRDRTAAAAQVEYAWPLDDMFRAFLFVEAGAVQPAIDEWSAARGHVDYGGGIRGAEGASTWFALSAATSEDGDVGVLFQLGGL